MDSKQIQKDNKRKKKSRKQKKASLQKNQQNDVHKLINETPSASDSFLIDNGSSSKDQNCSFDQFLEGNLPSMTHLTNFAEMAKHMNAENIFINEMSNEEISQILGRSLLEQTSHSNLSLQAFKEEFFSNAEILTQRVNKCEDKDCCENQSNDQIESKNSKNILLDQRLSQVQENMKKCHNLDEIKSIYKQPFSKGFKESLFYQKLTNNAAQDFQPSQENMECIEDFMANSQDVEEFKSPKTRQKDNSEEKPAKIGQNLNQTVEKADADILTGQSLVNQTYQSKLTELLVADDSDSSDDSASKKKRLFGRVQNKESLNKEGEQNFQTDVDVSDDYFENVENYGQQFFKRPAKVDPLNSQLSHNLLAFQKRRGNTKFSTFIQNFGLERGFGQKQLSEMFAGINMPQISEGSQIHDAQNLMVDSKKIQKNAALSKQSTGKILNSNEDYFSRFDDFEDPTYLINQIFYTDDQRVLNSVDNEVTRNRQNWLSDAYKDSLNQSNNFVQIKKLRAPLINNLFKNCDMTESKKSDQGKYLSSNSESSSISDQLNRQFDEIEKQESAIEIMGPKFYLLKLVEFNKIHVMDLQNYQTIFQNGNPFQYKKAESVVGSNAWRVLLDSENVKELQEIKNCITRLLRQKLIREELRLGLEAYQFEGNEGERRILLDSLAVMVKKMTSILYKKCFAVSIIKHKTVNSARFDENRLSSEVQFTFSEFSNINSSNFGMAQNQETQKVTEVLWKDFLSEKQAYTAVIQKMCELYEHTLDKASFFRKFCDKIFSGVPGYSFLSFDALFKGFFFLFVYKDFILREVVSRVKSNQIAVQQRKGQVQVLSRLDKDYQTFMETDLTTWVHLMLETGFFESYQIVVAPNEAVNVSRKKMQQDSQRAFQGVYRAAITGETANFLHLQSQYVKIYLALYADFNENGKMRKQAAEKVGIISQNRSENSDAHNLGTESLYLVPDSDFDSEDEQYGDDIEEIILSNSTENLNLDQNHVNADLKTKNSLISQTISNFPVSDTINMSADKRQNFEHKQSNQVSLDIENEELNSQNSLPTSLASPFMKLKDKCALIQDNDENKVDKNSTKEDLSSQDWKLLDFELFAEKLNVQSKDVEKRKRNSPFLAYNSSKNSKDKDSEISYSSKNQETNPNQSGQSEKTLHKNQKTEREWRNKKRKELAQSIFDSNPFKVNQKSQDISKFDIEAFRDISSLFGSFIDEETLTKISNNSPFSKPQSGNSDPTNLHPNQESHLNQNSTPLNNQNNLGKNKNSVNQSEDLIHKSLAKSEKLLLNLEEKLENHQIKAESQLVLADNFCQNSTELIQKLKQSGMPQMISPAFREQLRELYICQKEGLEMRISEINMKAKSANRQFTKQEANQLVELMDKKRDLAEQNANLAFLTCSANWASQDLDKTTANNLKSISMASRGIFANHPSKKDPNGQKDADKANNIQKNPLPSNSNSNSNPNQTQEEQTDEVKRKKKNRRKEKRKQRKKEKQMLAAGANGVEGVLPGQNKCPCSCHKAKDVGQNKMAIENLLQTEGGKQSDRQTEIAAEVLVDGDGQQTNEQLSACFLAPEFMWQGCAEERGCVATGDCAQDSELFKNKVDGYQQSANFVDNDVEFVEELRNFELRLNHATLSLQPEDIHTKVTVTTTATTADDEKTTGRSSSNLKSKVSVNDKKLSNPTLKTTERSSQNEVIEAERGKGEQVGSVICNQLHHYRKLKPNLSQRWLERVKQKRIDMFSQLEKHMNGQDTLNSESSQTAQSCC